MLDFVHQALARRITSLSEQGIKCIGQSNLTKHQLAEFTNARRSIRSSLATPSVGQSTVSTLDFERYAQERMVEGCVSRTVIDRDKPINRFWANAVSPHAYSPLVHIFELEEEGRSDSTEQVHVHYEGSDVQVNPSTTLRSPRLIPWQVYYFVQHALMQRLTGMEGGGADCLQVHLQVQVSALNDLRLQEHGLNMSQLTAFANSSICLGRSFFISHHSKKPQGRKSRKTSGLVTAKGWSRTSWRVQDLDDETKATFSMNLVLPLHTCRQQWELVYPGWELLTARRCENLPLGSLVKSFTGQRILGV
eukprot:760398-Hanusia_phi.AAC.1